MHKRPPLVLKVGGSLLRSPADYAAAAKAVAGRMAEGPAWVVVSAAKGVTDLLERIATGEEPARAASELQQRSSGLAVGTGLARQLHEAADASAREDAAALMAWGERASAAHLATYLDRELAGTGIRTPVVELEPSVPPPSHPHALVPGFFVRGADGGLRILPRGGSDISAVLVASWVGAPEARLWKEGGGIRLEPGLTAEHVDAPTLLRWLGDRVRPVHPSAVRLAGRLGVRLVLEDPSGAGGATQIAPMPASMPPSALPERMAEEALP